MRKKDGTTYAVPSQQVGHPDAASASLRIPLSGEPSLQVNLGVTKLGR